MPDKKSLTEYAQEHAKPSCKVCILPERAEIDEVYRTGVAPQRIILQWLHEEKGYNHSQVAAASLEKHFKNHHHYKA